MAQTVKRNKEAARKERRQDKEAKKAARAEERKGKPAAEDGIDPDIAGIVPGPQPRLDEE